MESGEWRVESGESYTSIKDFNIQSQVPQANYRIRVPLPFQWGQPTFDVEEAFAMIVASFVALVGVQIFALMEDPILDAIYERLRQKLYINDNKILYNGGVVNQISFIVRGNMVSVDADVNRAPLSEGDICGDELLTWSLDHSQTRAHKDAKRIKFTGHRLFSTRTVTCLTNVEAFSLRVVDLEEVTDLFPRLFRSSRVQGAIRMESGKSCASIEDFNIQSQVPQSKLLTLSHDMLFGILVMEDVNRSFTLIVLPGKRNRRVTKDLMLLRNRKGERKRKRKVSSGGALCYVELPEFGESNEGFWYFESRRAVRYTNYGCRKKEQKGDQGPDAADKKTEKAAKGKKKKKGWSLLEVLCSMLSWLNLEKQ